MSRSSAWAERAAYALMALATALYAVVTVRAASANPYWMDEVLAVWTARQPDWGAVWRALSRGAEFSPPLFHWLLHGLNAIGLGGRLAMRAPSILAVYGVAWCVFALVRPWRGLGPAALGFCFVLTSGLIDYAVQARPYALVAASFAVAVVLWRGIEETGRPRARAAVLAGALAAAVGLHFYAVLLAGALGLVELAWSLKHRRLRWPVLVAIAVGGASILLWWPILQHVAAFNRGDTAAPFYYARPTATKLAGAYVGALAGTAAIATSPLVMLMLSGVAAFIVSLRTPWRIGDLDLVAVAAGLIPVVVYGFAVVVSHTFNERYGIACVLGLALLMARAAAALPVPRWTAPVLALVLLAGFRAPLRTEPLADDLRADAALAERAPPGPPIVTSNGLRFLELRENTDPRTAARLVYLTAPDGAALSDPTNEHQVERWKTIDPALPVFPAAAYLATHGQLLLFRDPDAAAEAPDIVGAARAEPVDHASSATLFRVTVNP